MVAGLHSISIVVALFFQRLHPQLAGHRHVANTPLRTKFNCNITIPDPGLLSRGIGGAAHLRAVLVLDCHCSSCLLLLPVAGTVPGRS